MQKKRILKAVIFDWAGTIVDYGSLSTIVDIKKIFKKKKKKTTKIMNKKI